MVEAEVRTREMGRWRMGPGAKQCGVLEELDEAGNKFLLEPPEGPALLTLVLRPVGPVSDFCPSKLEDDTLVLF